MDTWVVVLLSVAGGMFVGAVLTIGYIANRLHDGWG